MGEFVHVLPVGVGLEQLLDVGLGQGVLGLAFFKFLAAVDEQYIELTPNC